MTEAPEPKSEFKFVLNGVSPDSIAAVAQELTTLFPLDLPTAINIAKNAPVILLDKLSVQQARNVGSYAIRLKTLGADVQVTSQPVGKLQALRWPVLPDIARRPATHIICPNCGSRLQVQVFVPQAQATSPSPTASAAGGVAAGAAPGPAPAPASVRPAPQPAPAAPRPVSTAGAPIAPLTRASAPSSPPSSPAPATAATAGSQEEEEIDEVVLEPAAGEEGDLLDLSDEEVVAASEPGGAAPGPPIGGEGSCRVTLIGRVRGRKRMQAAELMAYYMGITKEEAIAQLGKTVVTVGKDLTPEQAETCKNQFAEIGVKVTIKA